MRKLMDVLPRISKGISLESDSPAARRFVQSFMNQTGVLIRFLLCNDFYYTMMMMMMMMMWWW
jgi:hypothetical protein